MDPERIITMLDAPGLSGGMSRVDQIIMDAVGSGMEGFLMRRIESGKRLRPILLILAAGAQSRTPVLRAAAAIELVHQASKMHDDVLDKDTSETARYLLGGDLLLGSAMAIGAGQGRQTAQVLADTVALMIEGEFRQAGLKTGFLPDDSAYLEVCRLKTGSLFSAAAIIGGRLAKREEDQIGHLAEFGQKYGQAYQILDDIKDGEFKAGQLRPARDQAVRLHKAAIEALNGLPDTQEYLKRFAGITLPGLS
ncbi:MAG TPA: polyprenyl synthetase family protein [Candidatus Saccharimonadales bacterium]|nr:polyprenyl synthetase family protein [Candidatus Saccharimonadales bacterium]